MKSLYKTTIVIWRERPSEGLLELTDLAYQAQEGDAYCSSMTEDHIEDPTSDPDWDGTEFFDTDEEELAP